MACTEHHFTTCQSVGHNTVHNLSCPRRYMHHGQGFGVSPVRQCCQGEEQWGIQSTWKTQTTPSGCTKRTMKNALGEQDLRIHAEPISTGEHRATLKPCLADTGMSEAVSPCSTGWSRAALLVAPARTFLLRERNAYIVPRKG